MTINSPITIEMASTSRRGLVVTRLEGATLADMKVAVIDDGLRIKASKVIAVVTPAAKAPRRQSLALLHPKLELFRSSSQGKASYSM